MNSPIKAALSWFTRKFQEIVGDLPKDIQTEINNDVAPQQAVNNSFKKQGIFGKLRQRVTEVIEKAAGIGLGQKPKPMPELHTAWDASKMRLSEKLHGTDAKMRAAIIDTIREQLKLGKHAKDAALALYDGYNSGKHVVRQQQLPVYMQKIVNLARRGELTDEEKKHLQRLIRRAEAQTAKMGANGAPNKALKTAYNELLRAVDKGAGKALERGIKVAVEEKSRYVAERIARTEAARAWAEAFHARYKDDDEVLAYKWQLGSRHPNFDVCDMYAEANLYGLGKGIFPKDKCPTLPAHPHCLCHLTPIYKDETDLNGQRDRVKQGGDAWLAGLTHAERCKVLGIDGAKAWESGAGDWRESMRGYSPETLGTRLTEAAGRGKIQSMRGRNLAKAIDSIILVDDVDEHKFSPMDILSELKKSPIGRETIKRIENSDVIISIIDEKQAYTDRGDQKGKNIRIFSDNIKNQRVAGQTVIHEMTHYWYNIGGCQHAEAICFAMEKMHILGRDYLTKTEWQQMVKLAVDNYTMYEWEDGGYGDYSKFDFVR